MMSKAAQTIKDYNIARSVQDTEEKEARYEFDYQDSVAGDIIPWFLGLDGYEKWTARWLSENQYATIIIEDRYCNHDDFRCKKGVISAGAGTPVLRLPRKIELPKTELMKLRMQQRRISHEIMTKELIHTLRSYEGYLTTSMSWKVHSYILQMAIGVVNFNLHGGWKMVLKQNDEVPTWDIFWKVLYSLDDYGWRLANWKVKESERVLAWAERINARAEKHGILFEGIFFSHKYLKGREGYEDIDKAVHRRDSGNNITKTAWKVTF